MCPVDARYPQRFSIESKTHRIAPRKSQLEDRALLSRRRGGARSGSLVYIRSAVCMLRLYALDATTKLGRDVILGGANAVCNVCGTRTIGSR